METLVAKRSRSARQRAPAHGRRDAGITAPEGSTIISAPTEATLPAIPVSPSPAAPVSTKITMTDYGYVVGELRRIAALTLLIMVLLVVLWLVLR